MDIIREKLKLLPDNPGVYIMLDEFGVVIYVGKARVLKNRVRQYFQHSEKPEKVMAMVAHVADFNYIITPTEIDALALENNLIKKYKPKYNILLKDDKTYPYIKAHTEEEFPHFSITRKLTKSGKYFGPFMGGIRCKDILEVVSMVYRVRLCTTKIETKDKKPCLEQHIGRCLAPCAHMCNKADYKKQVSKAIAFLEGDYEDAERILEEKMRAFADNEEFELAMEYREKLSMLSKLKLKRLTAINRSIHADVIAYRTNNLYSSASVLVVRNGIMQGGSNYALEEAYSSEGEALTAFIIQYYSLRTPPEEIIVPEYCESELVEKYFVDKFGKSPVITMPKMGIRKKLLQMAEKNADDYLQKSVDKIRHKDDMTVRACERLKELLRLKNYPKRMECYDISDISGVDKVGSMVVFSDGEAERSSYRRFRIKTVEGANDFACLQEVLRRRLSKLKSEEEEKFPRPDLIIIDGGKGQLSAVEEIFKEFGVNAIDLISLAKREEEVFVPSQEGSILIDKKDYALKMLQRIRDEAHRFAITYFRTLHTKTAFASLFDEIEGIGKKKKTALMEKFGTIERLKNATVEELMQTGGIGEELAKRILDKFSSDGEAR